MFAGLKEGGAEQLFTAHSNRLRSALDDYNQVWLNVNSTYANCEEILTELKNDYQRSPFKPFFFIEGSYENEGADETCLRYQAYYPLLTGGMGHFYGNNPIWFFGSGWKRALDDQGAQKLIHFRYLFQSRPWHKLKPDFEETIITSGRGSFNNYDYAMAAKTIDSSCVIIYMPSSRDITIDLTRIAGDSVSIWWYNPKNGEATHEGYYAKEGTKSLSQQIYSDWVLVIDDKSMNYPAPGTLSSINSLIATNNFKPTTYYTLKQNYPNPFNSETKIEFDLLSSEIVDLKIYDLLGRPVRTLWQGWLHTGSYKFKLDARELPSGIYFYTLKSKKYRDTKRLLILK